MKQNLKAIREPLPNTKPILSNKTLRVTRNKLQSQLYLFSILASDKHAELQRELESYLSDRSFMELDLNKAMLLLAELIQLKNQTELVINQHNFFHNQLNQRGIR